MRYDEIDSHLRIQHQRNRLALILHDHRLLLQKQKIKKEIDTIGSVEGQNDLS